MRQEERKIYLQCSYLAELEENLKIFWLSSICSGINNLLKKLNQNTFYSKAVTLASLNRDLA